LLHYIDIGMKGWATANRPTSARDMSPAQEDRRRRAYDIIDEVAPIDGEVVYADGAPTRVDAEEIRAKAREQAARLHARL
jgi:hypothetical protein